MLDFVISIKYGYRTSNLRVHQIFLDKRIERFKVGSDRKHLIIETNRPLFRNRAFPIKHRLPDVKHISGDAPRGTLYDSIVKEVIRMADELDR